MKRVLPVKGCNPGLRHVPVVEIVVLQASREQARQFNKRWLECILLLLLLVDPIAWSRCFKLKLMHWSTRLEGYCLRQRHGNLASVGVCENRVVIQPTFHQNNIDLAHIQRRESGDAALYAFGLKISKNILIVLFIFNYMNNSLYYEAKNSVIVAHGIDSLALKC